MWVSASERVAPGSLEDAGHLPKQMLTLGSGGYTASQGSYASSGAGTYHVGTARERKPPSSLLQSTGQIKSLLAVEQGGLLKKGGRKNWKSKGN